MPVEGPITRKLQGAARDKLANGLTQQVTNAAHKVLDATSPLLGSLELSVDDAFVKDSVQDLLRSVLGEPSVGATPGVAELKDAAGSFLDASLTPAQRREKLARAAGDPLTDSVLAVLQDLVAVVPAGAFSKGGAALSKVMGDSNTAGQVQDKWFAPYLPTPGSVESLGSGLESLRERMKDPTFRAQLSRALDVVRALGRLEAHNLEKIAFDVGGPGDPQPERHAAVKRAFDAYALTSLEAIADACIPKDDESGRLARSLVSLGALHLRTSAGDTNSASPPSPDAAARFQFLVKGLSARATGDSTPASALESSADAAHKLPELLDAAQARLLADLEAAGALNAAARDGIEELGKDLSAVVVTAAHLLRFAGAAQNDKIPEQQRVALLKSAAKDAGPVVVKLLQTFANQEAAAGDAVDSVTMRALRELHEDVPHMTHAEVRAQVEAGLGMKLEEAFVSFDMNPLASASIGQVHVAKIRLRGFLSAPSDREVVVKVQRPNLDVEFARATRVARLGLQLAGELVRVLSDQKRDNGAPLLDLPKGMDPQKLMKLVEETVTSFVQSFEIETDFDKERNNLKKFRRDMSTHTYVTAPYVYRRHSSKTVLTMEYMKLEKLPSLIARADIAREQKKLPAPTGPLDRSSLEATFADVKRRALDHLPRAFGLHAIEGSAVIAADKAGGYAITFNTPHALHGLVKLRIEDNGVIRHVSVPPIIKDADVRIVRDHFLASLLSQAVVHGRVHGDPHKGNWGVLPDGKTIVMLDFGKMIDLDKKHLLAPLRVAWNWFRKDPAGMADALLTMTTDSKGADRKAARRALIDATSELLKKGTTSAPPEEVLATVTAALAQHGLGLSDVYTQSIKSGFSFAGNFGGLSAAGAGELGLGSWGTASRIAMGDALDSATFGVVGGVLALRKNARVSKLNER